jgi:hypothetical protein
MLVHTPIKPFKSREDLSENLPDDTFGKNENRVEKIY